MASHRATAPGRRPQGRDQLRHQARASDLCNSFQKGLTVVYKAVAARLFARAKVGYKTKLYWNRTFTPQEETNFG